MTIAMLFRLAKDQSGASATEYGILIAGIGLALFGAGQGFSHGSQIIWTYVTAQASAALSGSSS